MRIRATAAAVTGALALSAFVVPALAQADESPVKPTAADRFSVPAPAAMKGRAAAAADGPVITDVTVNGGKPIVLGTTAAKTVSASLTAEHPSGIADAYIDLWHGSNPGTDVDGLILPNGDAAACTAVSATKSTCKLTLTVTPEEDLYNAVAGTWHVTGAALAASDEDEAVTFDNYFGTTKVQRLSKLTVNASPEPVKKGGTVTVTGKLSRANWDTGSYAGYTRQPVKLEFRKKDSSTYTTVKTVTSDSKGNLRTTVKAASDGYYRYTFAGTSTTPAVKATGDFLDVR